MPKFEPIRVIISKNSPLENLNKIEGEIRNPISEIIKEMKTIDELKKDATESINYISKAVKSINDSHQYEDILSQAKAKLEPKSLKDVRNELIASNTLKEEAERLSSALSAGELGKLKAVSGEESGIQGTINMADSNVSSADHKKIMEKLRRATEKNWPSINQSVASKGNVMGINIDSKDYKYLLSTWFFPMVCALVLGFFLKKASIVETGPTGALAVEEPKDIKKPSPQVQAMPEPVKSQPKQLKKPQEQEEINWFARGKKHIEANEYKEAIAAFSNALKTDLNNEKIYYLRAVAYSKLADRLKALEDIKTAARLGHPKAIEYLQKNPAK